MEEKIQISLERARKMLKTADYMAYMTYPIVKENRLLIKILEEIHESLLNVVKAILQFEYLYKRVRLYADSESNFDIFASECANRYNISSEEVKNIKHVFYLVEKHKRSAMEFARKDRFVMMSDNMAIETVTFETLKNYINMTKNILRKAESLLVNGER